MVGEWRGTFALAASDVGDEMTNNGRLVGRSSVGGLAFLAVGGMEGRGRAGEVDAAAAEGKLGNTRSPSTRLAQGCGARKLSLLV